MLNCRGADLEVLGESALCAGHLGANNGCEGDESRGEQTVMTEQMERKNSVSIPDKTRVGRPRTPLARLVLQTSHRFHNLREGSY